MDMVHADIKDEEGISLDSNCLIVARKKRMTWNINIVSFCGASVTRADSELTQIRPVVREQGIQYSTGFDSP